MQIIDISGRWNSRTDETDCGLQNRYYEDTFAASDFLLPGSACENQVGKAQEYYDEFSAKAIRAPRERYEYIAPLWLQREVEIPESWAGQSIRLFLERVNIASELWIDQKKIGRQIIELSAPHCYDLTGVLTPGVHLLTLRIDNRNLLNLDTMSSGYSIDTQGYWNGIIGRMELQCRPVFHLENIQVYPEESGIRVKITHTSDVVSPLVTRDAVLELSVSGSDGVTYPTSSFDVRLFNSHQVSYFTYPMDSYQTWNEFHPALYTLTVRYLHDSALDEKQVVFGMRDIKSKDREFLLNGEAISLRGTVNCAIYPLTGYPPMDLDSWLEYYRILKSYGLNHVRFHAWCPPENAFAAADALGVYLSVEMPLWLNRDVCVLECGEDPIHADYFHREALTISRTYGNHPSFLLFSNGNENMGDFELLEDITIQTKARDNRRLYTLTSNFDHPLLPCEDFLCAFEAGGHKVRIQDLHDRVAEDTCLDYRDAVSDVPVPVVSFETGQYCVYPDVDLMKKYTGNMLPVNLDAIKKHMEKHGVYHRLSDYIKASGDMAVKLYKEDIEAVMRTKKMGGFQLLALSDYTGQNTATVGILDAFYDEKGLISPEEFRNFCGPVVPLFKAKRIFSAAETLHAELDLYDYGAKKIRQPEFELTLSDADHIYAQITTTKQQVDIPLSGISRPSHLDVELRVNEYSNHWNIYVFPPVSEGASAPVIQNYRQLLRLTEEGGTAILGPDFLKNPIPGSFVPVFWSPMFFPTQNACGAMIQEEHSIFRNFPTGKYPDYQWKTLLEHCSSMDISGFPNDFVPLVEMVPNFADNTPASPLFEINVGKARILFCGFSFKEQEAPVMQLKKCLYDYVNSSAFSPKNHIAPKDFLALFQEEMH